jgi:hypothetical protein
MVKWVGVMYAEDRGQNVLKLNKLIRKGVYTYSLWS